MTTTVPSHFGSLHLSGNCTVSACRHCEECQLGPLLTWLVLGSRWLCGKCAVKETT